ncbi:hypothetical protein BST81_08465 [Leptolyngbya sp. 'hensonii']|nr:hypothetical protein BST81_08465 [Leptolyngbya sp. 'hensonii']
MNLQLQAGQLILGASQLSVQDSAGSERRLRFNFISRYHKGIQGHPVKAKTFKGFPFNLRHLINQSLTLIDLLRSKFTNSANREQVMANQERNPLATCQFNQASPTEI